MTLKRRSSLPSDRRSRGRTAAIGVAAALTAGAIAAPAAASAAPADPVEVTVSGDAVAAAAESRNGLTFKGFGVLSANSTSSLLMDYKAEHPEKYWELLTTLYGGDHPIMTTVKIEMGNDRNTSTGPNAATMRSRDEYPNVMREPGFQLAADAQRVAEGDVHLSILRWRTPAWVADKADEYLWFKNTALAAYREYGIMVDSINPDYNETHDPDEGAIIDFSAKLAADESGYEGATADDPNNGFASEEERELFHAIRTVAGDTVGTPPTSFGDQLTNPDDPALRDAVDIVGFHYSSADDANGNMTRAAEELDLEVWNSEGQATFSNSADRPHNTNDDGAGGAGTDIGGVNSALEMANWITTGFDASRRTLTIYQPAIGSFYDGFQYSSKELVSARDPWSGWLYYDAGLGVLQHFTQFAEIGWENPTGDPDAEGIWRAIPEASGSTLGRGNPPSGAREGGDSYTTLAAPDASDFSTVIVNDSSYERTYEITADDLAIGDDATMEVWETRAADAGEAYDANYLAPVGEIAPSGGTYTVTVAPWSAVTATTLDLAEAGDDGALAPREGAGNKLPTSPEPTAEGGGRDVLDTDDTGRGNGATGDGVLYADDFDYAGAPDIRTYDPETGELVDSGEGYLDSRGAKAKPDGTPAARAEDAGATPRYTNDTNGAFESVDTGDAERGRVLRQQVGPDMVGSAWTSGDPMTTIGDARWANYTASVDVLFEPGSGRYASIGAREQGGTSNGQNVSAAELRVDPEGAWSLRRYGDVVASGAASEVPETGFRTGSDVWNTIAVRVAGDTYTALINGAEVGEYVDPSPQAAGRVQLGSSFAFTQFDDLRIETIDGYTPYYTHIVDGMHQSSWADSSQPVLEFDDRWRHLNGRGMYEWQRSSSFSTGEGASLSYTFSGTGLDIIGSNGGEATLDVTVDGEPVLLGAPTLAAGTETTAFPLRGLADGEHTVTFATANAAEFNVDAVGVVEANADAAELDLAPLEAAIARGEEQKRGGSDPDEWAVVEATLAQAKAAVADAGAYGLDAEGAAGLTQRLDRAVEQLTALDVEEVGLAGAVDTEQELPATVVVDGEEREVTWDEESVGAERTPYETLAVRGVLDARTAVEAEFEVVPTGIRYYIDAGTGGEDSPQYAAVSGAFPGLLNDAVDRASGAEGQWGHLAEGVNRKDGTDLADKYSTGNWQAGPDLRYRLPLEAGTYTLTAGFTEWWSTTRPLAQSVSVGGEELASGAIDLSGANSRVSGDLTFTLEEDATVDYLVTREGVGSSDPVISWLAVAGEADSERLVLEPEATTRMIGKSVALVATVANADDTVADITVETEYGSKTFENVKPGRTVSAAFSTRQPEMPAGEMTVTGTGDDGATYEGVVAYDAAG
ncbi:family 16 glycoside hydrolase [Microbacterium halophytorum]|uniref:family 16 glycoside hydrolase n=1 Tax=Microbacterium halophytorum TaxID=2067568 RepID=UPI001319E70F|nr:family 16 glycoside hydrolase [Microbacterium halophytorum]